MTAPAPSEKSAAPSTSAQTPEAPGAEDRPSTPKRRQLVLDVATNKARLNRANFFEGPCNGFALAGIEDWSAWDGRPRLLSGPAGCGKTHLAHIFAAQSGAAILPAADLTPDLIAAAGAAPGLVIEDAHEMASPEAQRVAFHLYNQARDLRQPLLITGTGPLARWPLALPDLISRLQACLLLTLEAPDDLTLRMVLIKCFLDRQLAVGVETIEYALTRMERSFAGAAALVAALDDTNLEEHRPITKAMIRSYLTAPGDAISKGDPR